MKKLLIVLIAVVVVASSMAFGYYIARHPANPQETTTADYEASSSDTLSVTDGAETSSTEKTTINNNNLLLGAWQDNANFSGYEFFDNGTMKVTYFNMASLNLDGIIEGTYSGTYSVDGDRLTVSYTIYSKAIVKKYTYSVDENTLTLNENGDEAIYVRKGADAVIENVDKNLLGKWSSNLSGFEFKETGVVAITFIDLGSMGINIPLSGTVDGIYSINGDEISIKYSIYTGVIEKTYKYKIEKDTLTLTEKGSNETGTYIRKS